jgi:hypothetical protein
MCYQLPPCFVSISSFKVINELHCICESFTLVQSCLSGWDRKALNYQLSLASMCSGAGVPQDMKNYFWVPAWEKGWETVV